MKNGVEFAQEAQNLTYSLDGKSFAYIVNPGALSLTTMPDGTTAIGFSNKDTRDFIVKDGVAQKKYDSVYNPTYSPDGKHFAYTARTTEGRDVVVVDGTELQEDRFVSKISYSPDSKSFVYIAHKDNKSFIIKDGIKY
ncbi:PD40 domain-containing protein [Candidatus Peregrinibacteria bacterium]|nr:PD40 domain-containing protein [Candidatus Peregrinibacteria bacterium]